MFSFVKTLKWGWQAIILFMLAVVLFLAARAFWIGLGELALKHPTVGREVGELRSELMDLRLDSLKKSKEIGVFSNDIYMKSQLIDSLNTALASGENIVGQLQVQNRTLLKRAVYAEGLVREYKEQGERFCYRMIEVKVKQEGALFKKKVERLIRVACPERE